MIIIGYPGIGKTTLAYQKKGYIDFDSSNFRLGEKRCAYWNIYYCRIATDLSKQGHTVFVSAHEKVREYLEKSTEPVASICPELKLKDQWIDKLYRRYRDDTTLSVAYAKAFVRALHHYEEDVQTLLDCKAIPCITIGSMDYDLEGIIEVARTAVERRSMT